MWKQIIAPVALVIVLWILVNSTTTYYLFWLDNSYQNSMADNLTSIRAAGELCEETWRLLSYARTADSRNENSELNRYLPQANQKLHQVLRDLDAGATFPEERNLVKKIKQEATSLFELLNKYSRSPHTVDDFENLKKIAATTENISLKCAELRTLNEIFWSHSSAQRERWSSVIFIGRISFVTLGTSASIAIGWWTAKKLHRSISQINIILKGATEDWEQHVGQFHLDDRADLASVHERVQNVVERMRTVCSELDSARLETLRSERLAAVGELAAGVAHELRNPMTAIKLLLQHASLIHRGAVTLSEEQSRVVLEEISRMENTIQGLLDFSRPPSIQCHRHDMCQTLTRALNLTEGRAKQQHIQMRSIFPLQPVFVNGDSEQLHQVFVNLLLNGIEAMEHGGMLVINVILFSSPSPRVHVRFLDSGPGIPKNVLDHLFEPFVSTKERGTGLGLAICRRIVKQHKGELWAENQDGSGAIFTVELSLAESLESKDTHQA